MLIDQVDRENAVIGTVERSKVLKTGKNFRTVHAWLFDSNDNIVLQRLTSDHPRSPQLLGSSIAGYLKAGESFDKAINRKALFEVGMKPSALKAVGTIAMSDERSTKFVKLYVGKLQQEPQTLDVFIESFEFLRLAEVDQQIRKSPERFTATFRELYRNLRSKLR